MKKPKDPRHLALDLLNRSTCSVQCAAVLADGWGIFSWGHNHVGEGFGCHAEEMCMMRANFRRVPNAILYVAARRKRNRKTVTARPCEDCQRLIRKCLAVHFRDSDGKWHVL